ncbi:MAG TPA: glycoside hydrolase family 44 protein [Draconibacterium sp.]|nr:glycoside hydrolase family 44 protein [Draconibacterium sp.]
MKRKVFVNYWFLLIIFCFSLNSIQAQNIQITINAGENKRAVSPNIYGRNESFDKSDQFYKDAGLRFARVGGGNNMSAYNWRLKLTVHPDWFNNVYGTDWDGYAKKINDKFPNMQGMFAFQLLGRAASTGQNNFPDWSYMQAHPGWSGNNQNLAGGGTPNPAGGSKALVEGDINLFSKPWPADSSVAILGHWFGANGKGFNKTQLQYWSMDNECDVWNGTHDWAMPTLISASTFMDRFIELAKKAKAIEPDIKICGPVTTSEWQWYVWGEERIRINGTYYSWFEYFIKRCADEEKESGIRVLDVFDIHHYPYAPTDNDALQNHRIFYDKSYVYPGANGIKTINGGWDNSQTKEYIFQRINDWLTKYFGANHGITLGLSEWSPGPDKPNLASVIYATHLGTFANNGVEYFTPWNWFTGMWETLHLFSRNAKKYSVSSTSSLENTVSAYTTVTETADSMTVILVNRDMNLSHDVTVNLANFQASDGSYKTLQLASLPAGETFKSHTSNALKENSVTVSNNSFSMILPALSTTSVLLKSTVTAANDLKHPAGEIKIYPNPAKDVVQIDLFHQLESPVDVAVYDLAGRKIKNYNIAASGQETLTFDVHDIISGVYILTVSNKQFNITKRFNIAR